MKKKEQAAKTASEKRNPNASTGPWLPIWVIALAVMVVAAAGTFVLLEYVILSKLPRALLGTWTVMDGQMRGATLEFRRDGTMLGKSTKGGKQGIIEADVKVEGQTLLTTTINPGTGQPETGAQVIITLTDTEFVTEDDTGTRITMKRLR